MEDSSEEIHSQFHSNKIDIFLSPRGSDTVQESNDSQNSNKKIEDRPHTPKTSKRKIPSERHRAPLEV